MKTILALVLLMTGCYEEGELESKRKERASNNSRIEVIERFETDNTEVRYVKIDGMRCLLYGGGCSTGISCDWPNHGENYK